MKKNLLISIWMVLGLSVPKIVQAQFMVNGYIPNYRSVADINGIDYVNLDISYYAFVNTNADGSLVPVNSWDVGKMEACVANAHAAGKKVYICFGGLWGSSVIYTMANNATSRANFVSNIVAYMVANNFDGLDIDWEGLSTSGERTAHENLMADLRTAIDAEGGLGLTLTIGYGSYNAQWFSNAAVGYADYLQIMAYDDYGTWSSSPFGNHSSYIGATSAIAYWVGRSIAKSKMILGLPCYGYQFASTSGGSGTARSYASIVTAESDLKSSDDATANGLTLFNNQDIIMQKTQYAMDQGLAGVFFWEMTQDTDDKRSLHKAAMYTVNAVTPPPLANFLVSKKIPTVAEVITFTDHSSLGTTTDYDWNFGADATPATATGIGPHTVSYSTLGYKTIELMTTGPGGTDTKTKTSYINVSVASSTVDVSTVGISVYPNPNNGVFYIESQAIKLTGIEVYNALSTKVLGLEATGNTMVVDLSNQPIGMYILMLKTEGGTYSKKMLKNN